MTEKDMQILKLLEKSVNLETLRQKTGLTNSQLSSALKELRIKGYLIEQTCYEDGIEWSLMKHRSEAKVVNIIPNSTDFRFIAISDTHFGATFDSMYKLAMIYEYALKNEVHVIIHLGDVIEGTKYPDNQRFSCLEEQLQYVVSNYPHDDHIYNIIMFGNHEKHSISQYGFDVSNYLFDNRLDFVFLGYDTGQIKIYDKRILIVHKQNYQPSKTAYQKFELILAGHYHHSMIKNINNLWTVLVASLSNDPRITCAGAMDITILDSFENMLFKPLVVDKKVIPATEVFVKTKGSIH